MLYILKKTRKCSTHIYFHIKYIMLYFLKKKERTFVCHLYVWLIYLVIKSELWWIYQALSYVFILWIMWPELMNTQTSLVSVTCHEWALSQYRLSTEGILSSKMIILCAIFPSALCTISYCHEACVLLTVIGKTHQLLQFIYKMCADGGATHYPALASTSSTKLSWGFKSSEMWGWVITWDTPDMSISRQQTTFRVSQTTHLRTQCHMLHDTAVIIWTPARKCHLATASLALAIFSSHAFSCLPDDTVTWWAVSAVGCDASRHGCAPQLSLVRLFEAEVSVPNICPRLDGPVHTTQNIITTRPS